MKVIIAGQEIESTPETVLTIPINIIEIKNGEYHIPCFIFKTELPDGEYNQKDIGLKISDGEIYPKYTVGCYLVDSIINPCFPLLSFYENK